MADEQQQQPQPNFDHIAGHVQHTSAPVQQAAPAPPPTGLLYPGNIDLSNRPLVHNDDGTISSEYSTSFGDEHGHEVLVPTVVGGKFLTPDGKKPIPGSHEEHQMLKAAADHYRKTGEHMGIFASPEDADAYAQAVHERQDPRYNPNGRRVWTAPNSPAKSNPHDAGGAGGSWDESTPEKIDDYLTKKFPRTMHAADVIGRDVEGAVQGIAESGTGGDPVANAAHAVQAAPQIVENEQRREAEGYSAPYRALTTATEMAGVPTGAEGMEQAAKEGDTTGVLAHAVLPLALSGALGHGAEEAHVADVQKRLEQVPDIQHHDVTVEPEGPEWERTHRIMLDGEHVGTVAYDKTPDGTARILGSHVREDLRGQGLGKAGYRSAIEEAAADPNIHRVTSDPINTTEAAAHVWESLKKEYPVEDITHANGRPGYEIKFDEDRPVTVEAAEKHIAHPHDYTSEATVDHEAAHIIVGDRMGFPGVEIRSHLHPKLAGRAVADARMDLTSAGMQFDEKKGVWQIPRSAINRDFVDKIGVMQYAGAASDELFHNMPFETNEGAGGDKKWVDHFTSLIGMRGDEAKLYKAALYQQAKDILSEPGLRDKMKVHTAERAPGLHPALHMDYQGVHNMLRDIKGEEPNEPTTGFTKFRTWHKGINPDIDAAAVGQRRRFRTSVNPRGGANVAVGEGGTEAPTVGEGQSDLANAAVNPIAPPATSPSSVILTDERRAEISRMAREYAESRQFASQKTLAGAEGGGEPQQLTPDNNAALDKQELERGIVSTAVPAGRTPVSNPITQPTHVGLHLADDKTMQKYADIVKGMSDVRTPANMTDPYKIVRRAVDHFKSNLLDIWNSVAPEQREQTKKWYESAHTLATDTAKKYGLTDQQGAAGIAVLSPQRDWDQNVSLFERAADIFHTKRDQTMTPEMSDKLKQLTSKRDQKGQLINQDLGRLINEIGGKTLKELDTAHQAAFIRLYDEAHNARSYQRIDPGTGNKLNFVQNLGGDPRKVAWGSLDQIAKSISVMKDGSIENIHEQLGDAHKVRNFYNNILDPSNPRHVTIDTHAVAAAHWRPFGGSAPDVLKNFGGVSANNQGLHGTYPIYAQAYRELAGELGVLPREVQSVVWEKIRENYPDEFKRVKVHTDAISQIWKNYQDGKISLDKARAKVRQYSMEQVSAMQARQKGEE